MKKKLLTILLLLLIFVWALFLRIYFCHDAIFSDPIKYASDDGVYHMRLVENLLLGGHYPYRIMFDPYTYFPYGSYNYFAPLNDQLLAGVIWVAGWGHPTLELINKIAPYYPAILGALSIFFIYFIGKSLWGRKVGLASAFLAGTYSPYLFKSLLGANDHHALEIVCMAVYMMLVFYAIKARDSFGAPENSDNIKNKKKFIWLSLFCGLALGVYLWAWSGALVYVALFFTFAVLYYLIEYFSGKNKNWVLFLGTVSFLIALVMILPFYGHPDYAHAANIYDLKHLLFLGLGAVSFVIIGLLGNFLKKKKINPWVLPISLIAIAIVLLAASKLFFSPIFNALVDSLRAVNTGASPQELARELVSEMQPLGWAGALDSFSYQFYFAILGLIIIMVSYIRDRKPSYLLLIVWFFFMIIFSGIFPAIGQKRMAAYLGCNVALLSGFIIVKGYELGRKGLNLALNSPKSPLQQLALIGSNLLLFNIIFFVLFPAPFIFGADFSKDLPVFIQSSINVAKIPDAVYQNDWYKTMDWIRKNTPDPGIDYYALYQEPGIDKTTGKINPYPYPSTAYGILAQWDIGHMITYYAHRIPNANPFHQGVGKKQGNEIIEEGEAVFFIENNEDKAIQILNDLGTRYVITDSVSAKAQRYFLSQSLWATGQAENFSNKMPDITKLLTEFSNSMVVRLHLFDGRETEIEKSMGSQKVLVEISSLSHFRLVYESDTTESYSEDVFNQEIKQAKVFEYVKGARITGKTIPNSEISISSQITTNQNREFIYKQSQKTTDGTFEFIVPYATNQSEFQSNSAKSEKVTAQPYKIKIGNKEIKVSVTEEDVLNGNTVQANRESI